MCIEFSSAVVEEAVVDVLYIMVFISLGMSFGFLVFFFWAVDSDQWSSLDSASYEILDEQKHNKGVEI